MACRPDLRISGILLAALAVGGAVAAAPDKNSLAIAAEALARGDGIAAEVAARRAFDAGAARSDVAALIGEAELIQGDLSDARRWLGPGDFSPATREKGFHALGLLELREGDVAAAASAFDSALQPRGGSARLWVDIGRLRYLAGQHHSVPDALARALALDPREPRALEFQAQFVRDGQGLQSALPLLERALEVAPDDLGLLGEYAATLGEAGRHRDMLRVARRMVEINPRHPQAYYLQAVLAARAGLDDLARRLLARTQGAYDDAPAGQLLAGILELQSGNTALAVGRFDDLARRQPDNLEAHLLLGRALLANGEANEVVARLGPAADRPEASTYLLTLIGRAYEQLGRRVEAARYFDRAVAPHPGKVGVLPAHASAVGAAAEVSQIREMLAQGRASDASARAKALKERHSGSIDFEILSGDVALLTGSPAAALAAYERAATIRRDFALVERMVAAHRAMGQEARAVRLLADYLVQHPRSAAASTMLGRSLAGQGDRERAGRLLAHARNLRPDDAAYSEGRASGRVATTLARLRSITGELR